MRLLVALSLAPSQKRFLSALRTGIPAASWVSPSHYHVPLRPVGDVESRHVAEDIDHALAGVSFSPFNLQLMGVSISDASGSRPPSRNLRIDVVPCDGLIQLHVRIESALRQAGLPPDKRRFRPHVTIAQLPEPFDAEPWVRVHNLLRSEETLVDHFTLLEVFRGPDGPTHEKRATYGSAFDHVYPEGLDD
ncbi:RNA 2',3'-cyclic phosphodiesterase [Brytella acorum]|uniref:RNA 2',3'-cyclic phosphodiesterase n=1 Tax=Brytella acorum TaxID=2959299 RepID=UPI0025AE734F|nr:RNA 2',3'-cyclic phosphodiesterase [Brytella acorum]MDF3624329.1 RNA 2',3'-cyclic phosphodiesterase [Brytella acorum]